MGRLREQRSTRQKQAHWTNSDGMILNSSFQLTYEEFGGKLVDSLCAERFIDSAERERERLLKFTFIKPIGKM